MGKVKRYVNEPPAIDFGHLTFEQSNYERGGKHWYATTLLRACHAQELEPFEYPLAAYHLCELPFRLENMDDFIWQMRRTLDADYEKYPIILDDYGQIADGNHRIAHAILDGRKSILAYRLQTMPAPDYVLGNNQAGVRSEELDKSHHFRDNRP